MGVFQYYLKNNFKMVRNNIKSLTTFVCATYLGIFFIYKGIKKHWLSACKIFPENSTIPLDYQNLMNAFCHSGFTKMLGLFQVLAGILLCIPKTRLLGAFILLPICVNIFAIHLFIDNRPHELIETGIPLFLNLMIIFFNFKLVKNLFLN